MMRTYTIMKLSSIDLNLLFILHTVLREGSAAKAARQLHVTPSAISNALARLRGLLGDPLLVRQGRGLVPTPRAEALAPVLATAIEQLQVAVGVGPAFDPASSTRVFTLAAADNQLACDIPLVVARFARALPRASLRIVSPDYLIASDGLATGEVDAALAPVEAMPRGYRWLQPLFAESGVFLVRRGHRLAGRKMGRAEFNAALHIDVQIASGRPGSGARVAHRLWRRHRLRRTIALAVPHFGAAAMAAARTDYIASMPERAAALYRQLLKLEVVECPFVSPEVVSALVWHPRSDLDAGARYLRELIIDVLAEPRYRLAPKPRAQ
jgi:DNA-binding transcriptional LysR family regulator